jgi:hypothetical protein
LRPAAITLAAIAIALAGIGYVPANAEIRLRRGAEEN